MSEEWGLIIYLGTRYLGTTLGLQANLRHRLLKFLLACSLLVSGATLLRRPQKEPNLVFLGSIKPTSSEIQNT
jgi:hypothetical protein